MRSNTKNQPIYQSNQSNSKSVNQFQPAGHGTVCGHDRRELGLTVHHQLIQSTNRNFKKRKILQNQKKEIKGKLKENSKEKSGKIGTIGKNKGKYKRKEKGKMKGSNVL